MLQKNFVWIFDLDGTLFESHHQIIESVNLTRSLSNFPNRDDLEIFKRIGRPAEELFDDLQINAESLNELVGFFRENLREILKAGTPLYPGSLDVLKFVKGSGCLVAIATTKPDDLSQMMVELSPLSSFVDHTQGSTSLKPKPSPQVIFRVLEKLEVPVGVMVGDRVEDMEAASAAGIPSIGLAQTSHSQQLLKSAGASFTFNSIEELWVALLAGRLSLIPPD